MQLILAWGKAGIWGRTKTDSVEMEKEIRGT
jgi:hypothetical protein